MTDAPARRLLRLSAAAAAALVAILAVLVRAHTTWLDDADRSLERPVQRLTYEHRWVYDVARAVEWIFLPTAWVAVIVLAAVVLAARRHRRAAIWAVAVTVVTWLAAHLLKSAVGRHRPVWPHPTEVLRDPSFPSGHAAQIACTAGVAIVLVTMFVRRRSLRRVLIVLTLLLALLVGLDRILLGVHNPSDVLAGWALGACVVALGLALYDPTPVSIALTAEPLPEVYAGEDRRLGVVLNPAKIDDPGQFRAMVTAMATASGYASVAWWETTVEDTGFAMAHRAAVEGSHLVMVVGGDGTVRAVCEELAGTGIPVGIVPAGTGNLLARNLDVPLYLRAAVDVALNGQDRAIDMVTVSGDGMNDMTFLVMAGMGFDAAIMEGVNEDFKAKVGWLAYVWSALKSLMFPAMRVDVSVDDGPFTRHRARTVVIGNVGYLQAGMPLLPDASIDDGRLDVVLLYPRRFLSWLPLAARVLTRNRRTDETITRMTGRSVVVRAQTDMPRELDGDLIPPGREIRAECVHGRLLVRVPR